MATNISKKYNLNFRLDFDSINIIINFSRCMHAKQMILYLLERWEPTLTLKSKIIRIQSLHVELLSIKLKNSF